MDNNKNMKVLTIYGTSDNLNYVEMKVPENWTSTINVDNDIYGGYGIPYIFDVKHTSIDKTAYIKFNSPYYYVDDYLNNYNDFTIDDWGSLHRKFITLKEFLSATLNRKFSKYEDYKIDNYILSNNLEKAQENAKNRAIARLNKRNRTLTNYYYESGVLICSYIYNGRKRKHAIYAQEDASEFIKWDKVPNPGYIDNFMLESMKMVFPNLKFDNNSQSYIYTSEYQRNWSIETFLEMDCLQEDYAYVYKDLFLPTISNGVRIHDDLWDDLGKKQEEFNNKKKNIREEKKEIAEIERKAREEKRQRDKELYDYIRKNQNDIHDMINSSYEYKNQIDRKLSEQRSDTTLGNTRFIDRDGKEHVLHTYNDYAYKKGDDYITSDTKLDIGYDWEELKKKKY